MNAKPWGVVRYGTRAFEILIGSKGLVHVNSIAEQEAPVRAAERRRAGLAPIAPPEDEDAVMLALAERIAQVPVLEERLREAVDLIEQARSALEPRAFVNRGVAILSSEIDAFLAAVRS